MVCWTGVLLLLAFWAAACNANHLHKKDTELELCSELLCRAGRECVVGKDGEASCECIRNCPMHFSPVCGSNSHSYDNFCLLHRDACLTHQHISVKHKGYCLKDKAKSNKDAKKNRTTNKKKVASAKTHHERPVVCLQRERDALHRMVAQYFQHHQKDQTWYRKGMSPRELNWGRFYTCDTNHDNFLDANEFLECVKDHVTVPGHSKPNSDLIRALCVDAIIDAGDANSDWRLTFEEFQTTVDPAFKLPHKKCSLEGKQYEDAAETKVDCNECICACGNWVCTSATCDDTEDDFEDDILDDNDDDIDKKDTDLLTPEEWRRLLEKLEKKNL